MSNCKKVAFYVPEKFLERFDEAWKGHYTTRSGALLGAMRLFLEDLKKHGNM